MAGSWLSSREYMLKLLSRITDVLPGKEATAFLHVPKSGGTYQAQLETSKHPVISPLKYLGHSDVVDEDGDVNLTYLQHDQQHARDSVIARRDIRRYYMVSSVRNLFDWFVSYAGHAGAWNSRYQSSEHYDYENAQRGFDYLLKTIADREDQWPSRKFVHCQLFSSGGDLVVDWLNRTNSLDDDLQILARRRGLSFRKMQRQRVGGISDYRQHYSDPLVELVYSTWKRAIELFGFSYHLDSSTDGVLGLEISPQQKASIKYRWHDDRLDISRA